MQGKIYNFNAYLNAFPIIAGLFTIIVGLLVLIGWQIDIAMLKSILPGAVTMKPSTAVAFLLSGLALLFIQRQARAFNVIVRLVAVVITLIGLHKICQYVFGWNLGTDNMTVF